MRPTNFIKYFSKLTNPDPLTRSPIMFWRNSKYVIAVGSAVMIVLMAVLTTVGMSRLAEINRQVEALADMHLVKSNLLFSLRRIVRERSLTMYSIYLTPDAFDKDTEFLRFRNLAVEFITLRQQLESIGLSAEEQAVFAEGLGLIRKSAPLQNDIVDKMMDRELIDVYGLMSHVDLPLEKKILADFDRLVALEQKAMEKAFAEASNDYVRAFSYMLSLGVAVALLSAMVTFLVIRRTTLIEDALFQEKEKAQLTLQAIGDGVITTDSNGIVTYLNPVAEGLVGCRQEQAVGQPLGTVYAIREEATGALVAHCAIQADIDGPVVDIHRHFVLASRDGSKYIVEDSATPVRGAGGEKIGVLIVFRDVSHERSLSDQLSWQARHDDLTGLANRRELETVLTRLVQSAKLSRLQHAFLYLDLDQFKLVNDTCGHVAGDELLKQLAVVLKSHVRKADTLARLGGDEFGIVLEDCSLSSATRLATDVLNAVKEFRFMWEGKAFTLGVSVGVVGIDAESGDLRQILSAADASCYLAKDKGRSCVYVHEPNDQELFLRRSEMSWASRLRDAIEDGSFTIHLQQVRPISARAGQPYNELLLRMQTADGELVSPMAFIPAAERFGFMPEIDTWVVKETARWLREQNDAIQPDAIYAINISGQSVSNEGFMQVMVETFGDAKDYAGILCVELTETAAISNWRHALNFITQLKKQGVLFALDDFGSGMSSFGYLKNLPVDFLKIDGTFVRDIVDDPIDRVMVNAINQIGHEMGIMTIAEFVENDAILQCLIELGVDYAQGYGIHMPAPLANP